VQQTFPIPDFIPRTLKYPGPGFFFDGDNLMQTTRGAPRLGEHNDEIYCGRLGLSKEELARLRAARVI
jgi:crotonobetainyl-CoA:carnitine CoA-transferase CaiB-like acyl-CoA transferase